MPINGFAKKLNALLRKYSARIAGGFIARCILQYQLAAAQFFYSDNDFWTYNETRFFPDTTDIDIYVPQQNCAKFFTDFLSIINLEHASFHLSPAFGYKSFMRMNGILGRVQLAFNNKKCDILSCKRHISNIIENFDISGVCVSWDGKVLHINEQIAKSMDLISSHRFPQFRWALNPGYYKHWQDGNKCTHKRITKYTSLGVHIDIPTEFTFTFDYRYISCIHCNYNATHSQWGSPNPSFCARHAPPDSHFSSDLHLCARMIKYLHDVISNLGKDLHYTKKLALIRWKIDHCDPEFLFEITDKSPLMQTLKAIYKLITSHEQGFLMWICHAGECTVPEETCALFQDNASVTSGLDIYFYDCQPIFTFIIDQMIEEELFITPAHSCHLSYSVSKILHKDIDWYSFFIGIHPMYSAHKDFKLCLIVVDDYQIVYMAQDLFLAIIDIATNNAHYNIIGYNHFPGLYCTSRGPKNEICSDSWKQTFLQKNSNKLINIFLRNQID